MLAASAHVTPLRFVTKESAWWDDCKRVNMRFPALTLAILAAILISPAAYRASTAQTHATVPSAVLSETHDTAVVPNFDPIAPPGWDGALIAREFSLEESAGL